MPYRKKSDSDELKLIIRRIFDEEKFNPQLSYAEQTVSALRSAIIYGKLLPGAVLSEASISAAAGISRSPVREALKQLADEKLVDVYPQAGTVIAPIRVPLLKEGIFIRETLERQNILDLSRRITPAQLKDLHDNISEQEKAINADSHKKLFILDDLFHKTLFDSTERKHVWDVIVKEKYQLDRVRYLLLETIQIHARRSFNAHVEMYELLEKKQTARLDKAMSSHISLIMDHAMSLRETSPEHYFQD
jgi:DNA-binding GntR family transcriptional regulator